MLIISNLLFTFAKTQWLFGGALLSVRLYSSAGKMSHHAKHIILGVVITSKSGIAQNILARRDSAVINLFLKCTDSHLAAKGSPWTLPGLIACSVAIFRRVVERICADVYRYPSFV